MSCIAPRLGLYLVTLNFYFNPFFIRKFNAIFIVSSLFPWPLPTIDSVTIYNSKLNSMVMRNSFLSFSVFLLIFFFLILLGVQFKWMFLSNVPPPPSRAISFILIASCDMSIYHTDIAQPASNINKHLTVY